MAKNKTSKQSSQTSGTLTVEIVSPEGMIHSGECAQVTLPSTQGEVTILPEHTSLFTQLGIGEVVLQESSKTLSFAIMGGFLEVQNNLVRVISDFAIRAENISAAEAEEAKKRAERAVREKSENQDFVEIERDLQRSILQLDVAHRVRRRRRSAD